MSWVTIVHWFVGLLQSIFSANIPTNEDKEGKMTSVHFYPMIGVQCTCLDTHYAYKELTNGCTMVTKDELVITLYLKSVTD